jgi:hypothetical protein
MKTFCQVLILIRLLLHFGDCLKLDLYGREAREPIGKPGIIGTIGAIAVIGLVLYGAGAFSNLGGGN